MPVRPRLPVGLFLLASFLTSIPGAEAADPGRPYRYSVETAVSGAGLEWAENALDLYLDSYVGEALASRPADDHESFALTASIATEDGDLVYLVHLETETGRVAESELRGPSAEVASWLSDLALVVEGTVFPRVSGERRRKGPTASTKALLLFLEAGTREGYEERVSTLTRALGEDPGFAEARWQLGVLHFAAGRFEEALDAFERYLEMRPASTRAAENSGLCAARMAAGNGGGESYSGGELHLAPHRTSRSSVWLTALPVFLPVAEGSGAAPGAEAVTPGETVRRTHPAREGDAREELEGYRRRNRVLEGLAREQEDLAIRLAREALAAQRDLREARERIVELESRFGAPARAEAEIPAAEGLRRALTLAEAETRQLREEADVLSGENERLREESLLLRERLRALEGSSEGRAVEEERAASERLRTEVEMERTHRRTCEEALAEREEALIDLEKRVGESEFRLEQAEKESQACEERVFEAEALAAEVLEGKAELENSVVRLESLNEDMYGELKRRGRELDGLREAAEAANRREDLLAREKAVLADRLAEAERGLKAAAQEAERARASADELPSLLKERDSLAGTVAGLEEDLAGRREEERSLRELLSQAEDEREEERRRRAALERERERLEALNERLAGKVREAALRGLLPGEAPVPP